MIALWVIVMGTNRIESTIGFSCPRGGPRAGRRHVLLQSMEGSSEEEEYDLDDGGVRQSLSQIRWLPSVKLGRQPFTGPSASSTRRENVAGSAYEKLAGDTGNDDRPPGFQNIDILPVLPLQMLTGLDAIVDEPADSDDYLANGEEDDRFPCGVWDDSSNNAMSVMFGGASKYLPHTKNHVLTVAETRYKVLYDDLLRMGNYYGRKKERAIRQNLEEELRSKGDDQAESRRFDVDSLEDPDEKRRFVVTIQNPAEDGVMAEYGLLFQLKDLDEIAAVTSYDMGGDSMTVDEIRSLIESNLSPEEIAAISEGEEDDVMDVLLQSHYEATHDVIGRVKIHRFINPDAWAEGPDSREYLMAETSIVELVDEYDKSAVLSVAKTLQETAKENAEDEVSNAVTRIKDELRSVLDEGAERTQEIQSTGSVNKNIYKNEIPLVPQGILVERRSDESLSVKERAIRQSFARLVSLQHELKEDCRFTKASIKTFGLGRVGFWLSAAAWSQFITKRLESAYGEMQVDLQAKLAQLVGSNGSDNNAKSAEGTETIDYEDLPVELQDEYQLITNRAMDELGPLALERAVNIQCIVQATSYNERLGVLKDCVDNERRRLEAKKMLLGLDKDAFERPMMTRDDANAMLERLVTATSTDMIDDETFQ